MADPAPAEAVTAEGLPVGYRPDPAWEVTPCQANEALAIENSVLLDCRTERERAIAAITASILIPLQQLPARVNELEWARRRRIIVYCHHGRRSLQAARFLRSQGFADVKSMAGGIEAWSLAVDRTMPRY